jgi:hypothetical protein
MISSGYRTFSITGISQAETVEEIAEFWGTHSVADCWEETYEVEVAVRAKRRRRVTLDPELFEKLEAQARSRELLPETLANLWLAERVQQAIEAS